MRRSSAGRSAPATQYTPRSAMGSDSGSRPASAATALTTALRPGTSPSGASPDPSSSNTDPSTRTAPSTRPAGDTRAASIFDPPPSTSRSAGLVTGSGPARRRPPGQPPQDAGHRLGGAAGPGVQ